MFGSHMGTRASEYQLKEDPYRKCYGLFCFDWFLHDARENKLT